MTNRIRLTHCKDGTLVSTISMLGLGQIGGDYETAVCNPNISSEGFESIERYETLSEAVMGHHKYVALHGGRSLRDRIFHLLNPLTQGGDECLSQGDKP